MTSTVTIEEKLEFLDWFQNYEQLKNWECVWIMNYIKNHPDVLKNVHFVDDISFAPRGLMISTEKSSYTAFRFQKEQLITADVDKAFHDIRLNHHESLYIQLNFANANQNHLFINVLEENPFIPYDYTITKDDREQAEQLLSSLTYEYHMNELKKKIDQALDEGNKDAFNLYVTKYDTLKAQFAPQLLLK